MKTKDLFRLVTTVVQSPNDDGIRKQFNLKMCCVWKSIILEGSFMSSMTSVERCTSQAVRAVLYGKIKHFHTVLGMKHS